MAEFDREPIIAALIGEKIPVTDDNIRRLDGPLRALARASGCCRFGERAFAGASGNDEDAPIPAVRGAAMESPGSTPKAVTPIGA